MPATDVHVNAASDAIEPPDAAANEHCLRVVSVAAFVVPAEPGAPVWSFIHGSPSFVQFAFPHRASNAFAQYAAANPSAIYNLCFEYASDAAIRATQDVFADFPWRRGRRKFEHAALLEPFLDAFDRAFHQLL